MKPLLPVLAALSLLSVRADVAPSPAAQPNVLIIAVDDLNHWVRHLGRNTQVQTPNLDRLAARGVSFSRAYTASSVCNPSRAALWTGMRPSTTGIYGNGTDWRTIVGDGYTLPGYLRRNGYRTFGVGKLFHTSRQIRASDWDAYPQNPRGDDSLAQNESSHAPTESPGTSTEAVTTTAGDLSIAELPGGDASVGDYWSASAAIAELNAPHDRPFLIACGIFRPHLPWHVPKAYFDLYPETSIELPPHLDNDLDDVPGARPSPEHLKILSEGSWKRAVRAYMACITYADAQIGRILDALEDSPHRGNTVVVVWGDHGWHLGEKQKWRKTGLWEEAARMPYLWAGPGLPRGVRLDTPVDLMSLYPTLLDLLNLPRPAHVEGVSLAGLLRGSEPVGELPPALTTWHVNNHSVRSARWRYLRWANGNEELYDHDADPYEWYNLLHSSHAARAGGIDLKAIRTELSGHFPRINRLPEEGAKLFGGESVPSNPDRPERRRERGSQGTDTR
jgi:arylsulfatase A-like enzyme